MNKAVHTVVSNRYKTKCPDELNITTYKEERTPFTKREVEEV